MVATVVIGGLLLALVALCVWYIVRTLRKGAKEGVAVACLGCSAYKSGMCNHHCTENTAPDAALLPAQQAALHPCEVPV